MSLLATACGDDGGDSASEGTGGDGATTSSLEPKQGGSITMGMFSETAGLDPVVTFGGGATGTTEVGAVYDTLMRYDTDTSEYVPHLAASLESNDDKTSWTLKLRPDVKFTDGTPLDAEAVVFGMKRHVQYGSRASALVAQVDEFVVVDSTTVRFDLKAPYANFPYVLSFTPGMIPSPTAIKEQCKIGQPDEVKSARECTFNTDPVGAGPYMIDSFKPKESINLKRNPDYWGGTPHLDTLRFVTMTEGTQVFENLKANTIQMGYTRDPEPGKKAEDDPEIETYLNLVWGGSGLVINNGLVACRGGLPASICAGKPDSIVELDTPTKDKRIRHAIAAAIDPDVIDERVNNGTGYPGGEYFQEGSKWASSAPVNEYDLERAKALVQEVKAEGEWDGGVRLTCSPAQATLSIAVKTLLEAAGFTVDAITPADTASQIGLITVAKDYDIGCWGFTTGEEAPEVPYGLFLNASATGNSMNHQITAIDEQSKIIREAASDEDRKAALEKVQDIWRDEMPSVIYAATPERIMWRSEVHGVTPNVASTVLWHDVWID